MLRTGATVNGGVRVNDGERAADGEPLPDGRDPRQVLIDALHLAGGNKSQAARILSIDRSTLYRRMKRFGLEE